MATSPPNRSRRSSSRLGRSRIRPGRARRAFKMATGYAFVVEAMSYQVSWLFREDTAAAAVVAPTFLRIKFECRSNRDVSCKTIAHV